MNHETQTRKQCNDHQPQYVHDTILQRCLPAESSDTPRDLECCFTYRDSAMIPVGRTAAEGFSPASPRARWIGPESCGQGGGSPPFCNIQIATILSCSRPRISNRNCENCWKSKRWPEKFKKTGWNVRIETWKMDWNRNRKTCRSVKTIQDWIAKLEEIDWNFQGDFSNIQMNGWNVNQRMATRSRFPIFFGFFSSRARKRLVWLGQCQVAFLPFQPGKQIHSNVLKRLLATQFTRCQKKHTRPTFKHGYQPDGDETELSQVA